MREVEFLPDWYPKVRKRRRSVALQAWVTLILLSGLGLWMLLVQRNVHAREIEIAALHSDLDQSENELARLEDLLQLQRQLGQQDQIFLKIGRPVETTRIITTLEQMMPADMALLDLTLETEEPARGGNGSGGGLSARAQREKGHESPKLRFRMHGVAPTDMDLGEFLAKLTGRPFFKNVELMYSHERQDRGHVMREFEVTFTMDLAGISGGSGGR
ncbi:MAG: type pilus assembly protein PilN [Phycisphaerales bacterium]|jgi:Tfp pilus assembly protein PilN|nr:type pilus assembly protein PilN [Phycisphaerales bacterium]